MEATLSPLLITFPISVGVSILFTLSIIDLAKKKQLFDVNNQLKLHAEKVCSLGGISIFSAFWISVSLVSGFSGDGTVGFLLAGAFILFLTGVKDDLVGISPLKRLLIQISVATLLFAGGVKLTYIPGFDFELPLAVSYLLTITLIGAIVNAYNFIDGINGLAGGLTVIATLTFSVVFYISGLENHAIMALSLSGAVMGFLLFNFGKAKIFMGDNGSTFNGVMLSYFTIVFLQHHTLNGGSITWSPVVLLAVLIVPMLDMLKVISVRVLKGISPFNGDRTHIHHLMLNRGLKQASSCFVLYTWNIVAILIAIHFLPENIILSSFMLLVLGSMPYMAIYLFSDTHSEKELPRFRHTETTDII